MTNRKTIRLSEATRYKEETGESFPRWQEQIVKYEEEGGYYIHFSNVPRIGLYLVNRYNTPIGFYAYPLDRDKMESFAIERPYAVIFKPKPEAKILELKTYSEGDYKADVDKLVEMGYSLEDIKKAAKEARIKKPAGKLWNVTRVLSSSSSNLYGDSTGTRGGGPTGKWTMLLKKLGYDGVNDDCLSIIHPSEPCQAVFFDTSKVDLVKIVDLKGSNIRDIEDLFDIGMRDYQRKLALAKKSSPKLLASLAQDSNWKVRATVAENEKTPPEILKSLLFDTSIIRAMLAKNKNSPEDLLSALANDNEYGIRMAVANNNFVTPKVLLVLANLKDNENSTIRRTVASHTNVTPEILRMLSTDSAMSVRGEVAENESTPPDVLAALAKDEYCRFNVAKNKSTPQEVLRDLANPEKEKNWEIREAVAENAKTSQDILEMLAKDPDRLVRHAAFQRLTVKQNMTEALVMEKVLWKLLKRRL